MLTNTKEHKRSRGLIAAALVAAICLGNSPLAGAFGTVSGGVESSGTGKCAFSKQLQDSVAVRRQYLVKLDGVLNPSALAGNTVEEMYGQIVPASFGDDGGRSSLKAFSFNKKGNLKALSVDDLSADCMGCHDGASATAVGIVLRDQPTRHGQVDSFTSDHPIGMTYNNYVAFSRGYKPIAPNKMVFVNGRVGCLTCHDPLNQEKGHLVMSDRKSALCLTCHNK